MKSLFDPFLESNGVVVLDGALATELERRGGDLDHPLWSARLLMEEPGLIEQVHLEYFRAGADIATTASYQATLEGFARLGLSAEQASELFQLSVRLACAAREEFWAEEESHTGRIRPLVAASAGSYGAFLADGSEYHGNYDLSKEDLIDFHRGRLEVLLDSEADLIAFETIPSLLEGEAVIRLLEDYPGAKAWLSFSGGDDHRVCHGELFRDCVALANQLDQVVAVGLNCTPPRFVEALLQDAGGITEKYLVAYPNSGEGWDAKRRSWTNDPVAGFAGLSRLWYNAGARLIGGCCRTTPNDIRDIALEFGSVR